MARRDRYSIQMLQINVSRLVAHNQDKVHYVPLASERSELILPGASILDRLRARLLVVLGVINSTVCVRAKVGLLSGKGTPRGRLRLGWMKGVRARVSVGSKGDICLANWSSASPVESLDFLLFDPSLL